MHRGHTTTSWAQAVPWRGAQQTERFTALLHTHTGAKHGARRTRATHERTHLSTQHSSSTATVSTCCYSADHDAASMGQCMRSAEINSMPWRPLAQRNELTHCTVLCMANDGRPPVGGVAKGSLVGGAVVVCVLPATTSDGEQPE